ncbi:MAG: ATP-binding cassette domain-containing protein [Myxococcota bacterium]
MDNDTILSIRGLGLELGDKKLLDNVTMDVWRGHVHAIVGPNGAGKSTLAATVMGLSGYQHHTGDVTFEGSLLNGMSIDERARLGITMGWQEPARYEGLSVRSFIRAGARDRGDAHLASMLDLVGLTPSNYLDRAVDRTLSGGERKRIELASIAAMEPKLVMMDEPDSGIDVDALNRIFDAIKYLKQRGATVLLITHSMAVLRQADHGFLLCQGKVISKGGLDKLEAMFGKQCIPCDHPNEPRGEELSDAVN